jgi:pSer/pThr/pTyr-binding forkhead associated (FHA) protein
MAQWLSEWVEWWSGPSTGRPALSYPVLIWRNPSNRDENVPPPTVAGSEIKQPEVEPLVFQVRNAPLNVGQPLITVGRNPYSDLLIEDSSVSRFHAYFVSDARSGLWKLVDMASKFGTSIDGQALTPHQAEPVADGAEVGFGSVHLTFLLPPSFTARLDRLAGSRTAP